MTGVETAILMWIVSSLVCCLIDNCLFDADLQTSIGCYFSWHMSHSGCLYTCCCMQPQSSNQQR